MCPFLQALIHVYAVQGLGCSECFVPVVFVPSFPIFLEGQQLLCWSEGVWLGAAASFEELIRQQIYVSQHGVTKGAHRRGCGDFGAGAVS